MASKTLAARMSDSYGWLTIGAVVPALHISNAGKGTIGAYISSTSCDNEERGFLELQYLCDVES